MKTFIKFLGLFVCLVAATNATCNVCNTANGRACYSKTQYQNCNAKNQPCDTIYRCPPHTVCVSQPYGVKCLKQSKYGGKADCQGCNKCDATHTFACTGTHTFALCLGSDTPDSASTGQCAPGLTCNTANSQICATQAPTCTYAEAAATTTTTPTTTSTGLPHSSSPADYCASVMKVGNYPVGTNAANTCRQYIRCILLNGSWTGSSYHCPGTLYFSPSSGLCVSDLPDTCS